MFRGGSRTVDSRSEYKESKEYKMRDWIEYL